MGTPVLGRVSVVDEVARLLRDRIAHREFIPGQRLREIDLAAEYGVSRNTLREAVRILMHEDLLVRENHRGVVVRNMGVEDISQIYLSRRIIECAAIREIGLQSEPVLDGLRKAVSDGKSLAHTDGWVAVGSADIVFHRTLVAAAGSRHLDRLMTAMAAELRLAFSLIPDEDLEDFHLPFLGLNQQMCEMLELGKTTEAETFMIEYLRLAEQRLLDATAAG